MLTYFYIALGSAIGGMARNYCVVTANNYFSTLFPYGTFIINIVGSFIIGCFAALIAEKTNLPPNLQKFVMVGFCGGYTTFSSFSLDTFKLLENSEFILAGTYIVFSILFCLLSVFVGFSLIKTVFA